VAGSGEIAFHGESYSEGASHFDGAHDDLSDAESSHEGLQGKTADQLDGWIPGLGSGIREVEGTLGKGLSAAKSNAKDISAKLRDSRDTMNQAEADSTRPSEDVLRGLKSNGADTSSGPEGGASGPASGTAGGSGSDVGRILSGDSPRSSSDRITSAGDSPGAAKGNDAACTNGDPVDVATGDVLLTETDVSLPGLLPLVLERTHRSSWRTGRWFGPGWLSSLDQRLEVNAGRVRGAFADGRIVTWHLPSEGDAVVPESGPVWTLRRTSRESYEVHDPRRGLTWRYERRPGHYQGVFGAGEFPLVSVADRAGHEVSFQYDASGAPEAVTHSGGYQVEVTVADGLVAALTVAGDDEPLRRFSYDEDGNLTEVINSSGLPLRLSYDDSGRLTGWEDRNGQFYRYAYDDESGRCVSGEGPDGTLSGTFTYETGVTRWTNFGGAVTSYELTDSGLLAALTDPLGNTTRWEHDDRGNVLAVSDPLDRVTRYVYNAHDNMTAVIRPDGAQALAEYDQRCLPVLITDPDGSAWRQGFDEHGNRTSVTASDGAITRFEYDEHHHLAAVIAPDGSVTHVACNTAGLPESATGPDGQETRYERDHAGRTIRIASPDGGVTAMDWTPEGRPAACTLPDGSTEAWTWDAEGNLSRHVSPAGAVTTYEYGPFDKPIAKTGPSGARTEFGYDHELHLNRVTHGGLTWHYDVDLAGRLTAETDFNGATTRYQYGPDGLPVARISATGEETAYEYDVCGNLVAQRSDDTVTTFGYDAAGRIIQARNADADIRLERDPLGRITAETCNGRTTATAYDSAGRVVRRVTPSGAETLWSYDISGLLTEMTSTGQQLWFGYGPGGQETHRGLPGGLTITQDWDLCGRLTTQALSSPGGPEVQRRTYSYRPDGFVTGIDDLLAGSRSFSLEPTGRVNTVRGSEWNERYAYDPAGNVTSDAQGARDVDGTLTTRAGNIRYRHDAAGRVVARTRPRISRKPETWHYTWDTDNRLISATIPDGTIWRYRYDPFGRRIAKQHFTSGDELLEETRFTWDGLVLAEQTEITADHERVTTWDYRPQSFTPLSQSTVTTARDAPQEEIDRQFSSIVTDLTGTPTELIGADGTLAGYQRRTLWGETTWYPSGIGTPLRFPGQYEDPETDLHHNGQRVYDPAVGAYLSPDPLGLAPGPNPHAYVPNPLAEIDPLGLMGCGPHLALGHTGLMETVEYGGKTFTGRNENALRDFAAEHGAVTYMHSMFNDFREKYTTPETLGPKLIDHIVEHNGKISFNLKGIDVKAIMGGTRNGWTAEELRYIARTPAARAITTFYNGPDPF